MIIMTGVLFSCKNNQDGYSDELNTNINPSDSLNAVSDTTNAVNSNGAVTNDTGTIDTNAKSSDTSSGGPGPSPKDGAAYTNYSEAQNDTSYTNKKKIKKTDTRK